MKKLLLPILLLVFSCDETVAPDTTAPTVVITYPANNSTLDSTITVKADVADNSDVSSVIFLIDGSKAYTDTSSPYEYEWDVCVQSTGNHTVLVKAEDSAGNQGQSDIFTFTINASYDCDSVCGGDKLLDNCDVCDTDSTNNCTADCNGDWGGSAYTDECDDCVGGNTELTACMQDDCGIWGGDSSPNTGTCDCGGTPNGTANLDNWGTCCFYPIPNGFCDCNSEYVSLWGGCYNIEETTELDLYDNQLTGEIPPSIGNLTNLIHLNLRANQLTSVICIPTSIN